MNSVKVDLTTDDDNELQENDRGDDDGTNANAVDIENRFSAFRATTKHFPFKDDYGTKVVTYLKSSKIRKSHINMTRDLGFVKLMADKAVKNRDAEYVRSLRETRSVKDVISRCERIAGRGRLLSFSAANSVIQHQKTHSDTANVHRKLIHHWLTSRDSHTITIVVK
ncbi:hypothetical protein K501DRAFT_271920 [Backusella circina FSU 941]|nr:hypothetical protein K501DRAFT_271920 [Backusella circina FSU 941]